MIFSGMVFCAENPGNDWAASPSLNLSFRIESIVDQIGGNAGCINELVAIYLNESKCIFASAKV